MSSLKYFLSLFFMSSTILGRPKILAIKGLKGYRTATHIIVIWDISNQCSHSEGKEALSPALPPSDVIFPELHLTPPFMSRLLMPWGLPYVSITPHLEMVNSETGSGGTRQKQE